METEQFSKKVLIAPACKQNPYWRELWSFRYFMVLFVRREFAIRYHQAVLGISWSVIQPLLSLMVLVIVFDKIAGLNAGVANVPYTVIVLSALIPWQMISSTVSSGNLIMVKNANMVRKLYFPRLVMPAGCVAVGLIEMLLTFVILLLFMVFIPYTPGAKVLFILPMLLLLLMHSFAYAVLFSILTAQYRDFFHIFPFALRLGMFISPIGYTIWDVPEEYRLLYSLNPIAGVMEGFRWAIVDGYTLYMPAVYISCFFGLVFLYIALKYFRNAERTIADVI